MEPRLVRALRTAQDSECLLPAAHPSYTDARHCPMGAGGSSLRAGGVLPLTLWGALGMDTQLSNPLLVLWKWHNHHVGTEYSHFRAAPATTPGSWGASVGQLAQGLGGKTTLACEARLRRASDKPGGGAVHGEELAGCATDGSGPGRPLGPQPGLAETREEEGEGGAQTQAWHPTTGEDRAHQSGAQELGVGATVSPGPGLKLRTGGGALLTGDQLCRM